MRRLMRVAVGDLREVDSVEGDCLQFYIDGDPKDAIDGEVDWVQKSYEITGGAGPDLILMFKDSGVVVSCLEILRDICRIVAWHD